MNRLLFSLLLLGGCATWISPVTHPEYAQRRYNEAYQGILTGHGLVCSTDWGFFYVRASNLIKSGEDEGVKWFVVRDTQGIERRVNSLVANPNCTAKDWE